VFAGELFDTAQVEFAGAEQRNNPNMDTILAAGDPEVWKSCGMRFSLNAAQ